MLRDDLHKVWTMLGGLRTQILNVLKRARLVLCIDGASAASAVWMQVLCTDPGGRWPPRDWRHPKSEATIPVKIFEPKYRLGHPENYLFLLSKKIIFRVKVSKK